MATVRKVVGSLAILRTEAGPDRYLYQGAVIGDGFTEESVEHAISVGLVAEVEVDDPDVDEAPAAELPAESWNNDHIDAWAAAQEPPIVFTNPEDASKAPTKKHRLAQVTAELEARAGQQ